MLKNMTYRPLLKSFSAIIDKNLSILYMDKEVRKVFNPWFHFVVLVNQIATWSGLNYIL